MRVSARRSAAFFLQALLLCAYLALALLPPYLLSRPSQSALGLSGADWYALPSWIHVCISLAIVWLIGRRHFRDLPATFPGILQLAYALLLYGLAVEVLYVAFHLPAAAVSAVAAFSRANPLWGAALVSSLLRLALFLPALAAGTFFLRWKTLRSLWPAALAGIVLLFAYSLVQLGQFYYIRFLGEPIVVLTQSLLELIPNGRPVLSEGLELQYGAFRVIIGPPCLGLDAIAFFSALYWVMCLAVARTRRLSVTKAVSVWLASAVIVYFLNVVRVAAIMVVGANTSREATDIFHQGIGALIVFGLFLVVLRWVLPWMARPKPAPKPVPRRAAAKAPAKKKAVQKAVIKKATKRKA
ncbi:MAG: exosortase/archaeosortase family protein [Candidatus Peribacteraceae bacterium]|nr:exosortase/archaeosortase family protein [Candidatus Peribacteraceae bacterium]